MHASIRRGASSTRHKYLFACPLWTELNVSMSASPELFSSSSSSPVPGHGYGCPGTVREEPLSDTPPFLKVESVRILLCVGRQLGRHSNRLSTYLLPKYSDSTYLVQIYHCTLWTRLSGQSVCWIFYVVAFYNTSNYDVCPNHVIMVVGKGWGWAFFHTPGTGTSYKLSSTNIK